MLRLDALTLRTGDFHLTTDQSLEPGFVSIIGPSGAGKSTLINAIAGFLPPVSGRVLWNGADITDHAPGDRPVSMIFQDNNLFPHLSVEANIGLALSLAARLTSDERRQIDAVLERVGMSGMGRRLPAELSGGQQSRVALARVLLADRPVVLLDEPFAALGPGLRQDMLALVKSTLSDKLVMMITHEPKDALRLGGRCILVSGGIADSARDVEALFDNPPEALASYLGS